METQFNRVRKKSSLKNRITKVKTQNIFPEIHKTATGSSQIWFGFPRR